MYLADFDPKKRIYFDCETTSGDDAVEAFHPYQGHRIAGIAIGQRGVEPIYLALRHRTQYEEGNECLPYDEVIGELRDFCEDCVDVCNINMKFDLHFMAESDGIHFPKAKIHELKVKARLVNNYQENFRLETLALIFCKTEKKSNLVKEWCDLNGTKDYGRVPLPLLSEYAKQDIRTAMELDEELEKLLPDESRDVWEHECRFMRLLYESERTGVPLCKDFFVKRQRMLLYNAVRTHAEIAKLVTARTEARCPGAGMDGDSFNPGSTKQINDYFTVMGIEPIAWTKDANGNDRNPQWNKDALSQIDDPVAQLIVEYNNHTHHESTFCRGWLAACDANSRMHPSFDSGGTATGRVSCRDPNMQNPPKWVWAGITIPKGYVGIAFDASQIEYRIFAHFARDESLLEVYRKNPREDFHRVLADRLGIPREFSKMLNFAILYGIGVKKLTKNIIRSIYTYDSEELRGKLRRYVVALCDARQTTALSLVPTYAHGGEKGTRKCSPESVIGNDVLTFISKAIITEYHQLTPAVKQLLYQIKDVIRQRGYIKNYFGRRYYFTADKAYIALNYLCQGTAADIFKRNVVEIFDDPIVKASGAQIVTNIHDAIYAIVPVENAQAYWDVCVKRFGVIPPTAASPDGFRVPILIDGHAAIGTWAIDRQVKIVGGVLESIGRELYATAA